MAIVENGNDARVISEICNYIRPTSCLT